MNLNSVNIKQEVVFSEPPRVLNNEPIVLSDDSGSDTDEYEFEPQGTTLRIFSPQPSTSRNTVISLGPHSPVPSTSRDTIINNNISEFRNCHGNNTSEQNSPVDIDKLIYNNNLIIEQYKKKIPRKELVKTEQHLAHSQVDLDIVVVDLVENNSQQPNRNVEHTGNSRSQRRGQQNVIQTIDLSDLDIPEQPTSQSPRFQPQAFQQQPQAFQPSTSQPPRFKPQTFQTSTSQPPRFEPQAFHPFTSQPPRFEPQALQPPRLQPQALQPNISQTPRFQPPNLQTYTSQPNQHPQYAGLQSPQPRPSVTCPICLGSLANATKASTVCGHIFCMDCIKNALQRNPKCPTCRKKLRKNGYHQIFI